MPLALCLSVGAALAQAPAVENEWRLGFGGEFNADPHGVLDVGWRRGALSAQLFTDTLEIKWGPESDAGRWWIAGRAEGGAAALMFAPWTDGAPDPTRALSAYYAGIEGGWLRYLPEGLYAGFTGHARGYSFAARDETTTAVPDPTPWLVADGVAGIWSNSLKGWARAGVDWTGAGFSPHVAGELKLYSMSFGRLRRRPAERERTASCFSHSAGWRRALQAELRAGWAQNQTALTRTRLGGLNPYVVPLAGAAWAEWWVEKYAALRLAPTWTNGVWWAGAGADGAWFDGQTAAGFLAEVLYNPRPWFARIEGGWAPWIERQDGIAPISVWLLVGRSWAPIGSD